MNYGDNDYNIEHISKEKLEQTGQLPDVLDVVDEVATLYHFNTPTNTPNDRMDDVETETNITAKEVEEKANTNDMNHQSGDEGMQTTHKAKGIPILPTCKWEDGGYGQ